MTRRLVVLAAALLLFPASAAAQRFEIGVGGGYSASEGITADERDYLGLVYDRAPVKSGGSFNLSFGVFASPEVLIEFLYSRQASTLRAEGPFTASLDVADLDVDTYHVNFVYHFSDTGVRPFAFGGLGATHYGFGDVVPTLLPTPNDTIDIPGETKFSSTWGAGVKFFPAPAIGLKFMMRWTPTYIKSDSDGLWCDPFYGCWVVGDPQYSHQFDISGGVTFKF